MPTLCVDYSDLEKIKEAPCPRVPGLSRSTVDRITQKSHMQDGKKEIANKKERFGHKGDTESMLK
jgi:hypothetical protein